MPPRWKSSATFLEYPLVSIALGPDSANNEIRGHARGIIAIGDVATGVLALGGIARGAIALGGLALGGIALGGCGIGILTFAGLALGYIAIGGCAIAYAAMGGLAIGHYAMGGAVIGKFVIGPLHHDPQAVDFFPSCAADFLSHPDQAGQRNKGIVISALRANPEMANVNERSVAAASSAARRDRKASAHPHRTARSPTAHKRELPSPAPRKASAHNSARDLYRYRHRAASAG